MTDILRFIIIIFAIYFLITLIYLFKERYSAVRKIKSLKQICGANIRVQNIPLGSYIKPSATPEAVVEIGSKVYLIRFLNGRSGNSFVHFASERFAVVYSKTHFSIGSLFARGAKLGYARGQGYVDTSRQKVYIIPKMRIPGKYKRAMTRGRREVIEVLLLSPQPCEVTYVTETKTSIKAAFTGDEVYGRCLLTVYEGRVVYSDLA